MNSDIRISAENLTLHNIAFKNADCKSTLLSTCWPSTPKPCHFLLAAMYASIFKIRHKAFYFNKAYSYGWLGDPELAPSHVTMSSVCWRTFCNALIISSPLTSFSPPCVYTSLHIIICVLRLPMFFFLLFSPTHPSANCSRWLPFPEHGFILLKGSSSFPPLPSAAYKGLSDWWFSQKFTSPIYNKLISFLI